MANESTIWTKLIASGMTKAGAAGLMGNLYAESALNPRNLQQSYEKSLEYTDDTYTSAVDSGKYTNFAKDSAGYGLAQWTFGARKQNLLNYAKSKGKSIGDLNMQLEFLIKELRSEYAGVWLILTTATDVRTASNAVLFKYESPADQGTAVQNKRYSYSMNFFNKFVAVDAPNKSVEEVAKEVLAGKWGNGDERKTNLTNAGYDYSEVQKAVNSLVSGASFEPTEKKSVKVTITIDDREYSGLLEEN